jgi:hypothetical protein
VTDWLAQLQRALAGRGNEIEPLGFLALVAASGVAALVVALLYVRYYGRQATGSDVHRAFPLLGVAVTAIFICIQFSLPLSLGLLGALSFIRFRAPVKDPEEMAYLLWLIAISIACATFAYALVGIILGLGVIALALRRLLTWKGFGEAGRSHLIVSGRSALLNEADLERVLGSRLMRLRLLRQERSAETMSAHYTFRARDLRDRAALTRELSVLPGVDRVDLVMHTGTGEGG